MNAVLLVELEDAIATRLREAGCRAGLTVEGATIAQAVSQLQQHDGEIGAVVMGAGTSDPIALAQLIRECDRDVPLFLLAPPHHVGRLSQKLMVIPALGDSVRCRSHARLAALADEIVAVATSSSAPHAPRERKATLPIWPAPARHAAVAYWDQLVEEAPLGIAVLDASTTILACNRRTGALLGIGSEELLGTRLSLLVPEGDRARWATLFVAAERTSSSTQPSCSRRAMVRGLHGQATARHLEAVATPIVGQGSRPGLMLLLSDVTERVSAEAAMADALARLDLALEAGRLGVWEWDLLADRLDWSAALCRIHGQEPGRFGGRFADLKASVHPDDLEHLEHTLISTLESGREDYQIEYRIVRGDGAVRWLESRGRVLRDRRGQPVRMRGVCSDITERKQAALDLIRSEAFHSATLMSVDDAVLATDADGVITLVNGSARRLLGVDDLLRGSAFDGAMRLLDERTRQPVPSLLEQVLDDATGRTERPLARAESPVRLLVRPDGTERVVDQSASPIVGGDGSVLGAVTVLRDISERRRAEQWREILAAARAALMSDVQPQTTLTRIARLLVERTADWCVIAIEDDDGVLHAVGHAHHDATQSDELEALLAAGALEVIVAEGLRGDLADGTRTPLRPVPGGVDDRVRTRLRALGDWHTVPVVGAGRSVGLLALGCAASARYGVTDAEAARRLGEDIGVALERTRLFAAVRRRARAASLVADIGVVVAHGGELGSMLSRSCEVMRGHAQAAQVRVWLLEEGELVPAASAGDETGACASRRVSLDDPEALAARVAREARPLRVEADDDSTSGGFLGYPLVVEGRLIGVLGLCPRAVPDEDLRAALSTSALTLAVGIERTRAEASREHLLGELRRTVHFSELFVGVLGHDLRNPLNAIMTSAQLLRMRARQEAAGVREPDRDQAALRTPLERILGSGERMARMIEQLLDLTRVRLGSGIRPNRARLDLEPLCRQVLDELLVAHPQWRLELVTRGSLTGEWDGDRLAQVVSNLAGNAVQHGDPARPLRVELDGEDEGQVVLRVWNAGVIPEALLPTLFDPFRGSSSRHASGAQGLGLGLFITQQLVEAHGGEIDVCSTAAGGTRFEVVLPRRESA